METKVNSATGLKVKVSKAAVACPPTKSSLRAARSGGIIVGKRTGAALAVTAVDRALILVVVTMTRRDVTRHALCNVERAPTQRDGPNSPRKKRKPNWDCNATTYQRCRDSPTQHLNCTRRWQHSAAIQRTCIDYKIHQHYDITPRFPLQPFREAITPQLTYDWNQMREGVMSTD